jgi:hypothetical protein
MRDGRWKLVLPAIDELMRVTPADLQIDVLSKMQPDQHMALTRDGASEHDTFIPSEPQLFDLAADPGETTDVAKLEPARVRRMEAELVAWFEEVEDERRTIADVW